MKSPSECEWKLGDTEALRDERQLGRHVDLLTDKAFSWKLPGGPGLSTDTLRQLGDQDKPHLLASQPGQLQRGVGPLTTAIFAFI